MDNGIQWRYNHMVDLIAFAKIQPNYPLKPKKKKSRANPKSKTLLLVVSRDVCAAFSLCFKIVRLQDLFGTSVRVNFSRKCKKRCTTKSFWGAEKKVIAYQFGHGLAMKQKKNRMTSH